MKVLRQFLLPFSVIYGIIVRVRNYLYDIGKLKSSSFPVVTIGIGNLTTGGTGKTPHVEYLIKLLYNEFRIATLSRGYGRKSKGYFLARLPANTHVIGDEPMQYLTKFDKILVAVAEDRSEGIVNLIRREDPPQVILLDDSYQHRKVIPGLNILLLEYDSIFYTDYLLPAGNLREPKSSIKRADVIIITKSTGILVPIERKRILEKLDAGANQSVFFSFIFFEKFSLLLLFTV